LASVSALAALELRIIDQAAGGLRQFVDALPISPVQVKVSIPFINSSIRGGRDGRRSRQHAQTFSRRLASVRALAALELRIIGSGTVGSRQLVDAVSFGPVTNIRVLVPDINASIRRGRDGRRSWEILETSSRLLAWIGTLTALELRIVNGAAGGLRQFVDAHTVGPAHVEVCIPFIDSSIRGRRDGRRSRQHAQTFSRRLASVRALATFELRIIGSGTVGSRQLVDAVSFGPVTNIRVLVPDINASVGGRRDGWRIRKISETSSSSLGGIITLAALELGVVNCAADRHGCGVDALANFEISIVGIPSIGPIGACGRHGRRGRQHTQTLPTRLVGKVRLAACKLSCESHFI
jgi:hypothetical protein